jgi:hypothetical protein
LTTFAILSCSYDFMTCISLDADDKWSFVLLDVASRELLGDDITRVTGS